MLNKIRVYKKTISFKNWEISFSKEIMEKINNQFDLYFKKGLEVGGYIFSEEQMKNKFHGKWVSAPNKKDIFKSSYYSLDLKEENKMIKEHLKNYRYLGIWHSHKDCSVSESELDKNNMITLLKELNEIFIYSLIFNVNEINVIFCYEENGKIKIKKKKIKRNSIWVQ